MIKSFARPCGLVKFAIKHAQDFVEVPTCTALDHLQNKATFYIDNLLEEIKSIKLNRLDKQFKKAKRVLIYIRLDKLNCTSPMATNHAKFIHSLILKIDHLVQIFQTFFTDFGKTKTRKT